MISRDNFVLSADVREQLTYSFGMIDHLFRRTSNDGLFKSLHTGKRRLVKETVMTMRTEG